VEGFGPWLLGVAAVLLLLVLVTGALLRWAPRRRRPGWRPTRPPGRRPAPPATHPPRQPSRPAAGVPRPGEIWWAEVPYGDGTGSKVRPCLVLRTRRRGADVLKITSQDRSGRHDHVRLPTKGWDPRAARDSYLDVTTSIRVRAGAFTRRAGACDPAVWRGVARLHGVAADR
jgi:hypothetical protein